MYFSDGRSVRFVVHYLHTPFCEVESCDEAGLAAFAVDANPIYLRKVVLAQQRLKWDTVKWNASHLPNGVAILHDLKILRRVELNNTASLIAFRPSLCVSEFAWLASD